MLRREKCNWRKGEHLFVRLLSARHGWAFCFGCKVNLYVATCSPSDHDNSHDLEVVPAEAWELIFSDLRTTEAEKDVYRKIAHRFLAGTPRWTDQGWSFCERCIAVIAPNDEILPAVERAQRPEDLRSNAL